MVPHVFLIEDEPLVATFLEVQLEELQWVLVDTACCLEDAVALASTVQCDVALIDVNLAGYASYPAARILRERGIPFVFATGYNAEPQPPSDLTDIPRIVKPFSVEQMVAAVQKLLQENV